MPDLRRYGWNTFRLKSFRHLCPPGPARTCSLSRLEAAHSQQPCEGSWDGLILLLFAHPIASRFLGRAPTTSAPMIKECDKLENNLFFLLFSVCVSVHLLFRERWHKVATGATGSVRMNCQWLLYRFRQTHHDTSLPLRCCCLAAGLRMEWGKLGNTCSFPPSLSLTLFGGEDDSTRTSNTSELFGQRAGSLSNYFPSDLSNRLTARFVGRFLFLHLLML